MEFNLCDPCASVVKTKVLILDEYKMAILARQSGHTGGRAMAKPEEMYQCQMVNCGCLYDPDRGDRRGKIPKGTCFGDLPEDWKCPVCGATKKMFRPLAGPGSVKEEG